MNIEGKKYGRLTVISKDSTNNKKWICECECGKVKSIWQSNLTTGRTLSCGCLASEITARRNYKHGGSKERLYEVWENMRKRCSNPKNNRYKNYGGKGVKVCDEWQEYKVFREWAYATGYDEFAEYGQCTIERIDVGGNYEPSNCTWKTIKEQCYNRTSNKILTYNGKSQTLTEWENEIGCGKYIIGNRLRKGWTVEEALSIPIGGKRGNSRAG